MFDRLILSVHPATLLDWITILKWANGEPDLYVGHIQNWIRPQMFHESFKPVWYLFETAFKAALADSAALDSLSKYFLRMPMRINKYIDWGFPFSISKLVT